MCSTLPPISESDQLLRFRLLVLGAGFSHAAGLPLGDELWRLTRKRALEGPGADKFRMDLAKYLDYRRECDGGSPSPNGRKEAILGSCGLTKMMHRKGGSGAGARPVGCSFGSPAVSVRVDPRHGWGHSTPVVPTVIAWNPCYKGCGTWYLFRTTW